MVDRFGRGCDRTPHPPMPRHRKPPRILLLPLALWVWVRSGWLRLKNGRRG